ncbi:MAG: hypothetical protein WCW16_01385 [Candidatus Magasanikbacteria bacterium]
MSDTHHEQHRSLTVAELEKYYFQMFLRKDDYDLWQDYMWNILKKVFEDQNLQGMSNQEKVREAGRRYKERYLGYPKTDNIVERVARETEEKLIQKLQSEGLV